MARKKKSRERAAPDTFELADSEKDRAVEMIRQSSCEWQADDDGTWDTGCGEKHVFEVDGPRENNYRFCPYCGRPLKGKKAREMTRRIIPPFLLFLLFTISSCNTHRIECPEGCRPEGDPNGTQWCVPEGDLEDTLPRDCE